MFYDVSRRWVYVLTSKEFLEVFRQEDPDHYRRIGHYPTPPHSQTGLFVPELDRLFVAVPAQGQQSAEIRVYQPRGQ